MKKIMMFMMALIFSMSPVLYAEDTETEKEKSKENNYQHRHRVEQKKEAKKEIKKKARKESSLARKKLKGKK